MSELVLAHATGMPEPSGIQRTIPTTLDADYGQGFDVSKVDVVDLWLETKRASNTRRAYHGEIQRFFGAEYSVEAVRAFLMWPPPQIAFALQAHKKQMMQAGLSETSINRRLSAIRSLLKFAKRLGAATTDGSNLIEGEKVQSYSDTTGISLDKARELLLAPSKKYRIKKLSPESPLRALRDTAILRIFCNNGLRCNEVHLLDVDDFALFDRKLKVLGKGRGTQKTTVRIDLPTAALIEAYRRAAGHEDGPLFRNLDRNPNTAGRRITTKALFNLVRDYGKQIGLPDLHPHALRHTAITEMLRANNGNITAAMEFSRHLDPKILMRYNHNAQDLQGQMTDLLQSLFDDVELEKPKKSRKR